MRVCPPRCSALSRRSTLWQAGPSPRRLPVGSLPRPPPTTGGTSHTRAREQHPVPQLPPTPRQSSHISQCSQGCPWPDSVPLLHLRTERTSRQAASGTLVRVPASFLIPAPLRRRLPDARAVGSWALQSHSSCLEPPPALGPEDTTPDTDLVPFTSPAELGWFGPSDICSLGQDGPAAAPQSPGHYALSPGIRPAEQRSTERCLGS